jgi:multiple sugar transport system substrate-binding protein
MRRWWVAVLAVLVVGCSGRKQDDAGPAAIEVWFHTGQPGEQRTIEGQVARFNGSQSEVVVHLTCLPEGGYNAQVQAAAAAGELPDVFEVDGPFLYRYVWQEMVRPLDGLLPDPIVADLLPSIRDQGTYHGLLYGVGTFDSGLGLWADRRRLAAAGAPIPEGPGQAWSADAFDRILDRLAADDPDGAVLDLKLNYTGEWYTYAFSPVLQSAGADLIERASGQAGNVIDAPAAVAALTRIQGWLQRGRVDPNLDDGAFTTGRVALSWAGHWEYPRYHAALGDNLVLLPLPDFGHGSRTGQGSWQWVIFARSPQPDAAARFLAFLLRPEEVAAMAAANGAVPATREAVAVSPLYREGGALRLFVEQLIGGISVPRPRTPAYPVITAAFQRAFDDLRNGGNVREALNRAAATIDRDFADNFGYPSAEEPP